MHVESHGYCTRMNHRAGTLDKDLHVVGCTVAELRFSSLGRHGFWLHEDWTHAPIDGLGLEEHRRGTARTALIDLDDHRGGERSPRHSASRANL